MRPFFSIIAPCCDVEPYLRECLASLLDQQFTDWECILGVETSKDKTEEIVREYAANDSRFRFFTAPRSGSCSMSRNTGTDMATGEYVIFLDGDDTIVEGCLQRLHDKISKRPGADLYPCAMLIHNEISGQDEPTRDNYPTDFNGELTGREATLMVYRERQDPCPMLQLTIFRREFLLEHNLKCIPGLRRQDSEFSPRALYYAKRVVPLHEQFYVYRIRVSSVSSSARGAGYFLGDWAIIIRSLFAFHAKVSKETDFDCRVGRCWSRQWLAWLFFFWFEPNNVRTIPRAKRTDTLKILFENGFGDFSSLAKYSSFLKRIPCCFVKAYVAYGFLSALSEYFFWAYYKLIGIVRKK